MQKPTIETAREEMCRLGLHANRFGHYRVGAYRMKFQKRCIRIERTFRYESGGRGSIRARSYPRLKRAGTCFYSRLAPGQLEGLVKLLKEKGGHNHGNEKSERSHV